MTNLIALTFLFVLTASQQTPLPCPPGQEYNCIECNRRCKNLNYQAVCSRDVCECYCKAGSGLVKDDSGSCVKPEDCPGPAYTCPPNQTFYDCDKNHNNICEPSCSDPRPTRCGGSCVGIVCNCIDGFVKDSSGRNCIAPEDCPKPIDSSHCPPNHTAIDCGPGRRISCTSSCKNPRFHWSSTCSCSGITCVCQGVYDDSKNCIKLKDCPGCPENQEMTEKGCRPVEPVEEEY